MIPCSRSSRSRAIAASGALAAVLAAGSALAILFVASSAHAFCREVTTSPDMPGYDPAAQGCWGSASQPPLFWRNQCIGYSIQKDASPKYVPLADVETIAYQAFSAWSHAPCDGQGGKPSISASQLSPVSCNRVPSAAHNNPIIFRDSGWPYNDAANSIGYTTLTVNLGTGEILGAAIEINSATHKISTSNPAPADAYDLETVLIHEVGHFLGLAHSEDNKAVMYAFYKPNSSMLAADDVAGICKIYPPSGLRSTLAGDMAATSCDPEPRFGFSDGCGSLDAGAVVRTGTQPLLGGDGGAAADAPCSDTLWGCSVGRGRSPGAGALFTCGVVALGTFGRRARRSSRKGESL